MTQDEIIEMAREAGDLVIDARGRMDFSFDEYGLEAFAKFVAAKEREACAKALEDASKAGRIVNLTFALKAIQARGQV